MSQTRVILMSMQPTMPKRKLKILLTVNDLQFVWSEYNEAIICGRGFVCYGTLCLMPRLAYNEAP